MTARPARWVFAIAVAAAILVARAASAGGLRADPQVGVVEIAAGASGEGTIVLGNDGATPVVASGITASPGCSTAVQLAPLGGFTLAPGATLPLAIACRPAPPGMQRCTYQVRAPDRAVLTELEAVCAYGTAPGLATDTTAVDLGTVVVGGAAAASIALHNTAGSAIDHVFVETTDLAGNFAVAAPCNPDARECDAGLAIAAGGTTSVVVTCTPRSPGAHTAALYLVSSAGTRIAAPLALSCTGAAATTPVLSALPGAVDVGRVAVADATARTRVHLSNPGTGTLRVLGVQLLDGGTGAAADWTVSAGAPCNPAIPPLCLLGAGKTADLDLVFDPRSPGVRDAILLLNYRDIADRSIAIPLRGTGDGPTLETIAAPAILDFGALRPGSSAALGIAVVNRGTRDLGDATIAVVPAGAPFSVSPGPTLGVAAAGTTTVTVTCAPTVAGKFTASLRLSAPDVAAAPSDITLRCTGDPAQVLAASPPALSLGEVRISEPVTARVTITSPDGPVSVVAADLDAAIPGLDVRGVPATTPAIVDLLAAPVFDGSLDNRLLVMPASGPVLELAVTGKAVTASYDAPAALSLGTFCVGQPTTPRIVTLSATGTATLRLSTPTLAHADSPLELGFDLALIAPLEYAGGTAGTTAGTLLAGEHATIAVTPRRQRTAGTISDEVIWRTDVADASTARTALTATFIDDGGAIAPDAIDFGAVQIYTTSASHARQVTLQNCSGSAIQLDAPIVPAPFSIESPNFPSVLGPSEIASFSVGFHPTQAKPVNKTLSITSSQLSQPLTVELAGEGTGSGSGGGTGTDGGEPTTSFYACGGCAARDPSSAIALALVVLGILGPRRGRVRRAER